MLDRFLADLEVLRAGMDEAPRTDVILRYRRRLLHDGSPSVAGMVHALATAHETVDSLLDRSELTVFLYHSGAPVNSKPFIAFPVVPTTYIEAAVDDQSPAVAIGWPAFGRAAVVQTGDTLLWPEGPGTSYLFAPRLD
jgi:hypothetical protein